jgi:hypothetical protein
LAGKADEMIKQIENAFKYMWHAEWEEGQEDDQQERRHDAKEKRTGEAGNAIPREKCDA